jgi:hypothetical protein
MSHWHKLLLVLFLAVGLAGNAFARAGAHSGHHGNTHRSSQAKHAFMKSYPCPSTGRTRGACPGYVVDHVVPLKRGGADYPGNMQWQTLKEAKAKDKWE